MLTIGPLRFQGVVQDVGCDGTAGHQLDLQQRLTDQQIEPADDSAAGLASAADARTVGQGS